MHFSTISSLHLARAAIMKFEKESTIVTQYFNFLTDVDNRPTLRHIQKKIHVVMFLGFLTSKYDYSSEKI
eukprot:snap_masked-scaffold_7-processed-gene-19.68-mRNA-1 protein AED:1.00 eAED:1.00 QI:0/0/0/0/1/1/2/0/69